MEQTLLNGFALKEARRKEAPSKRFFVGFTVRMFVIGVLLGCSFFFYAGAGKMLVLLCWFLLLGSVYNVIMQRRFGSVPESRSLAYQFLLGIAIALVINLVFLFTEYFSILKGLSYASVFLLPSVMQASWKFYKDIPPSISNVWYASVTFSSKPAFVYFGSQTLRLKIISKDKEQNYVSQVPKHLQLGFVFYYIIQEQQNAGNKTINFFDEKEKPYGWQFYSVWFGFWKRYLDAEKSLFENGVKNDSVIVVKCVTDSISVNERSITS